MRAGLWIALAALLAASPAAAEERKKPHPAEANWAARPTNEDFAAAYAKVVKPGAFYRAVIRCAVADDGVLKDCGVARETPTASGFGAAILALTPKYRRKPPGPKDPREVAIADEWFQYDKQADWRKRPSAEDLLAVFPSEAFRRGLGGKAIINCVATVQGALSECVTLEETPAGAGFGGAAIALTPQFTMRPATYKGEPVQSVVTIPINFVTYGPASTTGAKKVVTATLPWAQAPTFADVAAAYPPKARAEKRGGRATLSCDLTEQGRLARCEVAASEPKGYGFDTAAKALAKQFVFTVNTEDDRKATRAIEIHLPVTFDPAMLDQASPVVGKPSWVSVPQRDQVVDAFKDVAASGTSRATLACVVRTEGRVADCKVISETPTGAGVGEAAMKLAPHFRLTTWTAEGLPAVGGRVNIPIRYEGGKAATPAS